MKRGKIHKGFYLYFKTNVFQLLTLDHQVGLYTIPVSIGA